MRGLQRARSRTSITSMDTPMLPPDSTLDLTWSEDAWLFSVQPMSTAIAAIQAGSLPPCGAALLAPPEIVGVRRWIGAKAGRPMPAPYRDLVGHYTDLALTPRTRAAFGSSRPGTADAIHHRREDLVVVCVPHAAIAPGLPVYVDRNPMRDDARFSGDPRLLESASWGRIRLHAIRPGTDGDGALQRYDASVLVWGALPVKAVAAIACHGPASADRIKTVADSASVPVIVREDYFW